MKINYFGEPSTKSRCNTCGKIYPSAPEGTPHKCGSCENGYCYPFYESLNEDTRKTHFTDKEDFVKIINGLVLEIMRLGGDPIKSLFDITTDILNSRK